MIHIEHKAKGIEAKVSGNGAELAMEFAVGLSHIVKNLGEKNGAAFLADVVLTAMEIASMDTKECGEEVSIDINSIVRAMKEMEGNDDSV